LAPRGKNKTGLCVSLTFIFFFYFLFTSKQDILLYEMEQFV